MDPDDVEELPFGSERPWPVLDVGWQRVDLGPIEAAAVSPRLDAGLRDGAPLPLVRAERPFRAPRSTTLLRPWVLREAEAAGRRVEDAAKLRIAGGLVRPGPPTVAEPVVIGSASYVDGLCTSELSWRRFRDRRTRRELYDGLGWFVRNGRLRDLGAGGCADILGVSTLAFTADDRLLLRRQPDDAEQSPGLWAPSGSGSCDLEALRPDDDDLAVVARREMERELVEECAVPWVAVVATRLVGFARLLHRGGKPELLGVTRLSLRAAEVAAAGVAVAEEPLRGPPDASVPLRLALRAANAAAEGAPPAALLPPAC